MVAFGALVNGRLLEGFVEKKFGLGSGAGELGVFGRGCNLNFGGKFVDFKNFLVISKINYAKKIRIIAIDLICKTCD
jgi:hypothetical protein